MSHPAECELAAQWRQIRRSGSRRSGAVAEPRQNHCFCGDRASLLHRHALSLSRSDNGLGSLVSQVECELPAAFRSTRATAEAAPTGAFLAHLGRTSFGQRCFRAQLRSACEKHFLSAAPHDDADHLVDAEELRHVPSSDLAHMASLHEKLGRLSVAQQLFQLAAERDRSASSSSSFAIEVERLRRQLTADLERERISAAPSTSDVDWRAARAAEPREVDRVHHSQLSYQQFVERYVNKRRPVVILGLEELMFPRPSLLCADSSNRNPAAADTTPTFNAAPDDVGAWTFSSLLPHVSHLDSVPLKFSNAHSTNWAKLEERGSKSMTAVLNEMQAQRERELVESSSNASFSASAAAATTADSGVATPSYYVHDYSLALSAPSLLSHLTLPRYFSGDLFQSLTAGSMFRDAWPSLFVGARGSKSDLHVDTLSTHFWMAMLGARGARKKWILYDPEDAPLLYPTYGNFQSIDPTFDLVPYQAELVPTLDADVEAESPSSLVATSSAADAHFSTQHARYPLFSRAAPCVTVLRSGDVLFVPALTPHYVENLDTTLSISCNFLLEDNHDAFKKDAALMATLDANRHMKQVVEQMQSSGASEREERRVEGQQQTMLDRDAAASNTSSPVDSSWPRHLPYDVFKLDVDAAIDAASSPPLANPDDSTQNKRRKLDAADTATSAWVPAITVAERPPADPALPRKRQTLKHFF